MAFKRLISKKCILSSSINRLYHFNVNLSSQQINSPFHLITGQTIQDHLNSLASSKPNQVAYKFCASSSSSQITKSLTFLELRQRVDELAQSFMQLLGLKKGDRVAIMLPNVAEHVVSLFALAKIGCISVLMNPAYETPEIEIILQKTKAKAILISDNFQVYYIG